jgi:glutamine amidotransferase
VASERVYGTTAYGSQTFPCVIGGGSLVATQFHLEKSGELGLQVLKNFSDCLSPFCPFQSS